jgi:hypothetical protein
MDLDGVTFGRVIAATGVRELSAEQGRALVELARVAADADDRDDPDEAVAVDAIVHELCALARIDEPALSALPRDAIERAKRVDSIAVPLRGAPAAKLAYAIAFLVTVADFAIAPAEESFVEMVRDAAGLDEDGAKTVAAEVTELVTPGEE